MQVSAGGVLLTGKQVKGQEQAHIGDVVGVGEKVEIQVKTGDTIVYSKYGTTDVEVPDGKVVFVQEDSVLGVCA
jgi:co-chaperonin GroES (HSP10)